VVAENFRFLHAIVCEKAVNRPLSRIRRSASKERLERQPRF